jgi:hypothetical protein
MSDQTTFDAARARRTYTLTEHVTVRVDADLSDAFTCFAVFRALADRLSAAPLELDTPYGVATADIGLVTAVS